MIKIMEFESRFVALLPETHKLLGSANLVVHPRVAKITLHGSRGLAGGYSHDSDIDLCFIVDTSQLAGNLNPGDFLRDVLETTLINWQSTITADLAAIFDTRNCGLKCFDTTVFDKHLCQRHGSDCFGIYKINKGFNGFVTDAGVQVQLMYPCLTIWRNRTLLIKRS